MEHKNGESTSYRFPINYYKSNGLLFQNAVVKLITCIGKFVVVAIFE